MRVLVTGGAGFIGSHVADALLAKGHAVTVVDNLIGGKKEFIAQHFENPKFKFIQADLSDSAQLRTAMRGQEEVWHLAAKPDVRTYDARDFEKDVQITKNVLKAVHESSVKRIVYSSSSVVYGEAKQIPTPEDAPLNPISKYGESKAVCEALISEHCHTYGTRAWIFRFANVIGKRGTHGVIVDFIKKLRKNPGELEILGDGRQSKSYLLVQDCVAGMLTGVEKADEAVNIFNLGCEDWLSVRRIAEIVSEEMGLSPRFTFTGGERGWPGDVPKMMLDISKAKSLGWAPSLNSEEAVRKAVKMMLMP
ncbi:MAG: NAD-dependent epimerase/dehydratase family protein [Candidatus Aenigmatarchaeota archaeon]